ncbi:MAG TPA: ammonium transporter [Candidatus Nanoarchaeia archaeon]|nr:ammonium transporter [Candidatus Nanoarchaeia archaeon]
MSVVSVTSGDIAWLLISTGLVMLMTPALSLFYGGLVRRKNLVSTLVQCIIIFAVVSLVWLFWGYSLVYGPSIGGVIGNLSLVGLLHVSVSSVSSYAPHIPELLFFAFQLKFAAITPALIIGACAERIRFRSLLIFVILWSTLVYSPIAHWMWNANGWLHVLGAVDFAGGIVVHIAAGLSALAAALIVGRRSGCVYWKDHLKAIESKGGSPMPRANEFKPTNIPYVILGAGLLWFGWFGFNGGSALAADGVAVSAVVATNLAAAAGAVSWMLVDWFTKGKPSAVGICVGAVCGLAAVTAASGYVNVMAAVIIGLSAGIISNLIANWRSGRSRIDDTLDVFACHGVGGIIGSIGVGLFASTLINGNGVNGLFYGNAAQLGVQALAVVVVSVFSFGGSYLLLKFVNLFSPLRVTAEEEDAGLDISQHGEEAYHLD